MKILIVDDELISRQKLSLLLGKLGRCDVANDGEEAFEMFCQAHADNCPYQLMTLDFKMPGLSGPEVLQKVREYEQRNGIVSRDQWLKVVMVTAKDDASSIMASYKSGCEGYLTKPFNFEDIQKSLAKIGL